MGLMGIKDRQIATANQSAFNSAIKNFYKRRHIKNMIHSQLLVLLVLSGVCSLDAAVLPPEDFDVRNKDKSDVVPPMLQLTPLNQKWRSEVVIPGKVYQSSEGTKAAQGNLQWVSRDQITVLTDLVHGGSEGGVPQYVARGRISSTHQEWVPGKAISTNNRNFLIYSPFQGKEYKFEFTYQFLMASPGATSWVTANSMPSNAVIGGNDPANLDITHICRAVYDGKQMIGKTFTDAKSCYLPYRGGEYRSWASVQILVAN